VGVGAWCVVTSIAGSKDCEERELDLAERPESALSQSVGVRGPERWRVSGASTPRRLESWSEILADTHLAFDIQATPRTVGKFDGAVTRRRIGDLVLVDCAASPFVGHRSGALMGGQRDGAQSEEILGFQFVCRGVEQVSEGSRALALTAGDVVLWDGMQPTDVEIVESFYKRTLLFPRHRVLALCPRLGEVNAFPSLTHSGPARLLVRYMNALVAELPRLDVAASNAAANAALELLRAAIEPTLPPSRSVTRAAMRAEIRRYVRTHLHDPTLSPASIAGAYAMSVRALHALFEDADESVAGLVRSERLHRCLEDLQRPNSGSVTDIAFRWGFCDAAHFSRVFKREFGATPSEVRRAAVAEATESQ
jgi:AraC family transcriptional activator of tynA and feaB